MTSLTAVMPVIVTVTLTESLLQATGTAKTSNLDLLCRVGQG